MKLAILTSSLPPYPVGGAEHQAWETARRLAARGHAVDVFARRLPPDTPLRVVEHGVTWWRLPVAGLPGIRFLSHARAFGQAWKAAGPGAEVILAYQVVINGILAARARPTPFVLWIRSEEEAALASRKYRYWTPRVVSRAGRVLVQAEAIRTTLLASLARIAGNDAAQAVAPRVRVLPNATEIGPEPAYDGREGLVFVGRLVPQKGVDILLDALRAMPTPPPLRVLGDGPLREELQRRAHGLPVTFEGRVPLADVKARVSGARLLVAPSRTEGFPNAVLEAMERGVPVVASRVGALGDIVQDGTSGFLVAPGDAAALASRIQEALRDPGRWERLARGARAASTAYGWETHLAALETVLRDAVDGA
jgi:glycosyltransferase involved in cell wall biosynthesis